MRRIKESASSRVELVCRLSTHHQKITKIKEPERWNKKTDNLALPSPSETSISKDLDTRP